MLKQKKEEVSDRVREKARRLLNESRVTRLDEECGFAVANVIL